MLNLGVIGTNWITDEFIKAAVATGKYRMTSVYSRSIEKAVSFGEKYDAFCFESNINKFVEKEQMDVVYIASPNSLHCEQALLAIRAGKHVIIEKPACSNIEELEMVIQAARDKGVCFFEASRHIHEDNFKLLKEHLHDIGAVQGADLTYMKYSSRYDQVLAGEHVNIFSPDFSGGALADLGVYLVYFAVALFGVPEQSYYYCKKISTGADGQGTIIFRYADFDVTMKTGKIADSFLPSEIYGSHGTITLDSITAMKSVEIFDRKAGKTTQLAGPAGEPPMIYEAGCFADIIENFTDVDNQKKYHELTDLSKSVHKIMTGLRKGAGIVFQADK